MVTCGLRGLPAHGLTGRVPEAAYGAQAFIETISAVVDELGIRRFVLGGNSMGGATWRYAPSPAVWIRGC